jgi:hypothetical protein
MAVVKAKEDDSIRHQRRYRHQAPQRGTKRPREPGMLAVAGLIQCHHVYAMADTGVAPNLILSSLATELGYVRPPDHAIKGTDLQMVNGKHLKTIGAIKAVWSFFPEDKEEWTLTFHIAEDFSYDTMLGNDFLMSA